MKRLLRPIVSKTLSPKTVQGLRYQYWCFSSYFPRMLSSRWSRRTPEVRAFGAARSGLAKQLQSVNILAPTDMCRVMTKWGSDKGWNDYTPVYSALFKERCGNAMRVLEVGLGTNNVDMLSNMGVFGAPGASLRGWRELFPRASVFGADIDRRILFKEDRIRTLYCDQLNASSIRELWGDPDLRGGADIIIEDGLHTFEANVSFLEESLDHLRPGGVYVTEDILSDNLEDWYKRLETIYSKRYPNYEFAVVVLSRTGSNNLLVARRQNN